MTLLIVLAILGILGSFTIVRYRYWKQEGRKLQNSGYVPPAPPLLGRLAFRVITRLFRFLTIGPVKVIGRGNARYKGRLILAPNHTYPMDFTMVAAAVPNFHYMTAVEELKGLRGTAGAWTGAFGVDRKAPGEAVVQASVKILSRDRTTRVLIFPQGKLIADNVLRAEDFKTGAVRIARQTADKVKGEPVAILPIALYYERDRVHATWFHRLAHKLGLKFFRNVMGAANYGGTVAVGEPIAIESLPADAHEATELLRQKIQALLDRAKKS